MSCGESTVIINFLSTGFDLGHWVRGGF